MGETYSSYINNQEYPDILIYLPRSPIRIVTYSIRTLKGDIFPEKWELSASYDNNQWYTLSSREEKLCSNYSILSEKYFYYFRFSMKKNTHFGDGNGYNYEYALFTTGFDVSGSELVPLYKNTCSLKLYLPTSSLFLFILQIK